MKLKNILGIDIGGSGVKGAIVDTKKGKLLTVWPKGAAVAKPVLVK